MKKLIIALSFFSLNHIYSFAQEHGGMWIPNELNIQEMKKMGLKLKADDIYNTKKASLKDAVVLFGGGCTAEVISSQGLLLTNHHCGYGQIQAHSSLDHDYLTDGFWAKEIKDELPNEGLTATFIVSIQEVTQDIVKNTQNIKTEEERQKVIKQNIEALSKSFPKEGYQDILIKPFYKGNKYYLFVTETYKDIRLVGAPPSSIGKYGNDTDNWVWPRHTGDFSIFRIYANQNNLPAEYSSSNVPLKPKKFLPISLKDIEQDDFTMVYGFPGTTDEYLPASALELNEKFINPTRINLRTVALDVLDKKMRIDNETRIKYSSKYARISNYHKKWIGENLGLKKSHAVEKRKQYEENFGKTLVNSSNEAYKNLLPDLNRLYAAQAPFAVADTNFSEAFYQNSESFRMAILVGNSLDNQTTDFTNLTKTLNGIYKNYDADLDETASIALVDLYWKQNPKELNPINISDFSSDKFKIALENSYLTGKKSYNGKNFLKDLNDISKDPNFSNALKTDPLVVLVNEIKENYATKVLPTYENQQNQINALMRTYMQAQLDLVKDRKFFPDANLTLRVTYGKVEGYQPKDAVEYLPKTYLEGVIEKYIPGDYEYDLSPKMLALYAKKDYGKYAENGKLPVNFIATNHTTGGNSGSPVLDAKGNLIGINFDRVWEGTMSDLNYDPEICRNIMVDMKYVLWVIDKYAGASRLINELEIVD